MSTMVKRVAQALQQAMGTAAFDETASFALARAAIAAMLVLGAPATASCAAPSIATAGHGLTILQAS